MFRRPFYDKLDPSYRQALQKLEKDISNKKPFFYKFNETILVEFFTSYLMPEKIWTWIWNSSDGDEKAKGLYSLLLYQFCSCINGDYQLREYNYIVPRRKLLSKTIEQREGSLAIDVDIEDLCYPHNLLEFYLWCYEQHAKSHLPKKIIKRHFEMKKMYEKIISVEGNEEEWINAMAETDDIEFVKHNIEHKLGQDITNKKLWILYIKYLKEYDHQELLQVYSKYCRFFVDDFTMKEEYKKAAKIYAKPTVPWKNAFDFEIYDGSLLKFEYPERPEFVRWTKDNIPKHIPPPIVFTSTDTITQEFPFRPNFFDYIVKNANSTVLQQLNLTCKFFFNIYRIPVCYNLQILTAAQLWPLFKYKKESLIIHSDTLTEVNLHNFCISTNFYYSHSKVPLKSLIPKLHRCDAKYIEICIQKLSFEELKFFIGHGNVIDLCLGSCTITGTDNNENIFLEDIVELTPKLQYLSIRPSNCSKNTAQELCKLPFKNKFMTIKIGHGTNYLLEPNAFAEFINKNVSPNCKIITNFSINDDNKEIVQNFETTVKNAISHFWKGIKKPDFSIWGF